MSRAILVGGDVTSCHWGTPDTVEHVAEGIVWVSTPSHGGYLISKARYRAMPKQYRKTHARYGHVRAYEEDCDWALVALSWPEYFDDEDILDRAKHMYDAGWTSAVKVQ